jgi:hypothetical protein
MNIASLFAASATVCAEIDSPDATLLRRLLNQMG